MKRTLRVLPPPNETVLTEQELAKLTEYLDLLGAAYCLLQLAELSRTQAHELMMHARGCSR